MVSVREERSRVRHAYHFRQYAVYVDIAADTIADESPWKATAMFSLDSLQLEAALGPQPGAQAVGARGASASLPAASPSPSAEAFLYDDSSVSDGSLYGSDRENHLHVSTCKQLRMLSFKSH